MDWPSAQKIANLMDPLMPQGFRLRVLDADTQISRLLSLLNEWYGDIRVGMESYHLDSSFYVRTLGASSCFTQTDFLPLVLLDSGDDICGLVSFWKNSEAKHITSGLGVLAPHVRGKKMAFVGPQSLELLGRECGAGQVHYYVTLRTIAQQLVAEKMGFSLAGINPAWDRDAVGPTSSKRVYEAIYAKVLAPDDEVEIPLASNLSENVRSLFVRLFPRVSLIADKD